MRILLVSGSLPPMKCGVGDYTAHLATTLSRSREISVAVLTDVAATPVPEDLQFEVLPVARGWRMSDAARIIKAARQWHPDIMHIQYPTQGYGFRYLPWLLPTLFVMMNIPVVQTWHEYHLVVNRRELLNAAMGGGLIVVRPNYKTMMPVWFRWLIRRKRFQFIPNASTIPKVPLTETERSHVRRQFGATSADLVVFFGFVYPAKQIELLFDVADPEHQRLVLVCDLDPANAYHKTILQRINQEPWAGKVTVTGFRSPKEVGRLLSAADAVIFPFRDGGGAWNTSIHAAMTQGTFVLTTSLERHGYDSLENIYYARPGDVSDMRHALREFIGNRRKEENGSSAFGWESIAQAHLSFYRSLLSES